jgi:hypothetical protein
VPLAQTPMTEDQLLLAAPSVFAMEAHASRSSLYTPIPTTEIVTTLAGVGFRPYSARQSWAQDEGRRPFVKHLIRFRTEEMARTVGDVVPEVVAVNAFDGNSAYHFLAGTLATRLLERTDG